MTSSDDGFLEGTASWTRSSVNSDQIDFLGEDTVPHRFERYGWPGVYALDPDPEIFFWIGDPDNGERVELHKATLIVRPADRHRGGASCSWGVCLPSSSSPQV